MLIGFNVGIGGLLNIVHGMFVLLFEFVGV